MAGTDVDPDPDAAVRGRASLIDRPLDVDERERLFALRAASSEQAALYTAVLTVLAEAKEAYHLQMRTGEIRRRLEASPIADGFDDFSDRALRPALDQLRYKDQLIAYLQDFHDDLVRNRSLISRRLLDLDDHHRTELIRLADDGDDSTGLFGTGTGWATRWDGMLDWFVAGRVARSEADSLIGATTVAIRELLTLLRRLTEQATRRATRAVSSALIERHRLAETRLHGMPNSPRG